MSNVAAVVERVVATVTAVSPRGTATAVVRRTVASVSAVARQGLAGPPGPAGIAAALIIEQSSPSASWVIPHSLGRRPLVQVFDDAGELVYPDVVAGKTNVSVIFSVAMTGSVILF